MSSGGAWACGSSQRAVLRGGDGSDVGRQIRSPRRRAGGGVWAFVQGGARWKSTANAEANAKDMVKSTKNKKEAQRKNV